jgi:hypothetical protein
VSTLKPLLVYHPRETLDLQWILSSAGAFGWKTPKDRANCPRKEIMQLRKKERCHGVR